MIAVSSSEGGCSPDKVQICRAPSLLKSLANGSMFHVLLIVQEPAGTGSGEKSWSFENRVYKLAGRDMRPRVFELQTEDDFCVHLLPAPVLSRRGT